MPFKGTVEFGEEIFELFDLCVQFSWHVFFGAVEERCDRRYDVITFLYEVECGGFEYALVQHVEQLPPVVLQYIAGGRFGSQQREIVIDILLYFFSVASPNEEYFVVIVETGIRIAFGGGGNEDERRVRGCTVVDEHGVKSVFELQVVDSCQVEVVGLVERDGRFMVHKAGAE